MFKNYYKNMFRTPLVIIVFAIVLIYSLIPYFYKQSLELIGLTPEIIGQKILVIDKNYWSFFALNSAVCITIPLYALYCQYSRIYFQKESVIVRFDNNYSYWKRRIVCLLIDTVIFVLFIHVLLFFRLLFFNETYELIDNALSYLLIIPLNILGFLLFGLISQFAFALTGNTFLSVFFPYAFVVYDYLADKLLWPSVYISRTFSIWTEDFPHNFYNLFIVLIALTALIVVFVSVLVNRDCLIPKENKDAV